MSKASSMIAWIASQDHPVQAPPCKVVPVLAPAKARPALFDAPRRQPRVAYAGQPMTGSASAPLRYSEFSIWKR